MSRDGYFYNSGRDESFRTWIARQDNRAGSVGALIDDNATSIIVYRDSEDDPLAAQRVRIEMAGLSPQERIGSGSNVTALRMPAVIVGYKNHPTEDDTDLQQGDRFAAGGFMYVVKQIETTYADRLIAYAQVVE